LACDLLKGKTKTEVVQTCLKCPYVGCLHLDEVAGIKSKKSMYEQKSYVNLSKKSRPGKEELKKQFCRWCGFPLVRRPFNTSSDILQCWNCCPLDHQVQKYVDKTS